MNTLLCGENGPRGIVVPTVSESTSSIVRRLIAKLGSQSAVARALGASDTAVSRWREGLQPMNIDNCLLAAELLHEDPAVVLRASGKGDQADLLVRLYGKPAKTVPLTPTLSVEAKDLAERFDRMSPRDRTVVRAVFASLADEKGARTLHRKSG